MNNEAIREIINTNKNNLAFVIGNGINLNFLKEGIPSWKDLVNELWETHLNESTLNIDSIEGVSLTELYDLIELKCGENKKVNEVKDELKKEIAAKFSIPLTNNNFSEFVKNMHSLDVPIITTNFDTIIAQSIEGYKKRIMKSRLEVQGDKHNLYYYPWNVYYSDKELNSPTNGFGIWHINGIYEYPKSIRLGLCDYMKSVQKAQKMLHKEDLGELFSGKNEFKWSGSNTWLHILFNKNLFVFGLKLDENEVFLRWLLIQRAKYARMYNRPLKGWYVDKEISNGKKIFLKILGFEIVDIIDYNELYSVFDSRNL